jgi:hypothetical protein
MVERGAEWRRPFLAAGVLVFVVAGTLTSTSANSAEVPPGWKSRGLAPEHYQIAVDTETRHGGAASAVIRSRSRESNGFGTLMQCIAADMYRDRRVRLTAMVKAAHVRGWAGLWMRVDAEDADGIEFDNMEDRKITGTRDWKQHAVVLDVAQEAAEMCFGALLSGPGAVWVDDFELEVVWPSVKTTARPTQPTARTRPLGPGFPLGPVNSGFEEGPRTIPSPQP